MSQKMNRISRKTNSKNIKTILTIFVVIIAITILFLLNLFFGRPAPEYAGGKIPEMMRIARMEAGWYDIDVIRYDGTTMTWIIHKIWYDNDVKIYNKYAHDILETKGKLVEDWTPDDLRYPLYAFEIEPRIGQLDFKETGEMWVYSNGYLITQTGNVYECDIDFSDLMVANEHDFLREVDVDDINQMSWPMKSAKPWGPSASVVCGLPTFSMAPVW